MARTDMLVDAETATRGPATARRPRHLMDPANPVRPVNDASLTRVQRWIFSVLAVTTVAHMAVGMVAAAWVLPPDRVGGRVVLAVIAGCFWMIGAAGALAIHGRRVWSPWLLTGVAPGVLGLLLLVG